MDFIQQAANDYVAHYSDATPAYLRPMYEATKLSHPHAHLQLRQGIHHEGTE